MEKRERRGQERKRGLCVVVERERRERSLKHKTKNQKHTGFLKGEREVRTRERGQKKDNGKRETKRGCKEREFEREAHCVLCV